MRAAFAELNMATATVLKDPSMSHRNRCGRGTGSSAERRHYKWSPPSQLLLNAASSAKVLRHAGPIGSV
jgi:hypothetical protein